MSVSEWKTWYMCFKHSHTLEKEFLNRLEKHKAPDALFLICRETSKDGSHKKTEGQHYHFIMEITDKGAKNYMKHFIEKYKLRGQAKNGIGRQYGMTAVKDRERMCQYICKEISEDNPFVGTNMSELDIQRYKELSFVKYTYESYKFDLFRELETRHKTFKEMRSSPHQAIFDRMCEKYTEHFKIEREILSYHFEMMKKHETLKPIKRNQVVSLSEEYIQRYKLADIDHFEIYDKWFGFQQ